MMMLLGTVCLLLPHQQAVISLIAITERDYYGESPTGLECRSKWCTLDHEALLPFVTNHETPDGNAVSKATKDGFHSGYCRFLLVLFSKLHLGHVIINKFNCWHFARQCQSSRILSRVGGNILSIHILQKRY